jgi:predicted transcriptional regulator
VNYTLAKLIGKDFLVGLNGDTAAALVRRAMTSLGYTQEELAKWLNKSQPTVCKYLNGEVQPPSIVIIRCMNYLEGSDSAVAVEVLAARLVKEVGNYEDSLRIRRLVAGAIDMYVETHTSNISAPR